MNESDVSELASVPIGQFVSKINATEHLGLSPEEESAVTITTFYKLLLILLLS